MTLCTNISHRGSFSTRSISTETGCLFTLKDQWSSDGMSMMFPAIKILSSVY